MAPARLRAQWEENFDFRRSLVRECYTLRLNANFERRLAEVCAKDQFTYALARFSSAARYAPMVRYQRAMAYVVGSREDLAAIEPVSGRLEFFLLGNEPNFYAFVHGCCDPL